MDRKAIGDSAETLACEYLRRRGLRLLYRNYRCRRGEIDLVMMDGDSLVFVEVRYRRRTGFGGAAETVSKAKQKRIIFCAQAFLCRHRAWNRPARFDVVSIEGAPGNHKLDWLRNAFCQDN
jgi:putative endonuclease